MLTRAEIKRNLLGGLEAALFMPAARTRFGNTSEEAVRSFFIPILLIPLTMMAVYFFPESKISDRAANAFALLYCLRMALSWGIFLGSVYWLVREIDREEYFNQFVIAVNWLSIPATIAFLPIALMLLSGQSWQHVYPSIMCTLIYTYIFTAYMATSILRLPWEMGGFIAVIAFMVNDYTTHLLNVISQHL